MQLDASVKLLAWIMYLIFVYRDITINMAEGAHILRTRCRFVKGLQGVHNVKARRSLSHGYP